MFLIFVAPSAIFDIISQSDAKVLKATSSICVKQIPIINEKKVILAIMDEVKNMLDYEVGHYIKYEDIPLTRKIYFAHLCLSNKNSFLMETWIN